MNATAIHGPAAGACELASGGELRLEKVAVRYGDRVAVRRVTLQLSRGQFVALAGPNGAGKSSLLKAIAGVLPCQGRILLDGRALGPLPARTRARTLAYLPQSPTAHWPMRAADLVALGRLPYRQVGEPQSPADHSAIACAMAQTDSTSLADRRVDELSGGERTRVLLARALAVQAPVLLADEPVASLDPYHQLSIIAVLAEYARQGALVIVVLHDLALAARFCTRLVLLSDGALVADGTPDDVFASGVLERYYRIVPYLNRHEDEPVIVPWRTLG